jgi:hypothetical protein
MDNNLVKEIQKPFKNPILLYVILENSPVVFTSSDCEELNSRQSLNHNHISFILPIHVYINASVFNMRVIITLKINTIKNIILSAILLFKRTGSS